MILTRTYERDYSGLVTKITRPGGRYTRYCYDKLGRVIRADYYDKTYENFTYNKNGALIEAENQYGKVKNLDIYGRVKTEEALGEKNLIPFRFQGQYEDEETGLYYNRFRYYSPEERCYTQQDPIGLAGGNPTIYGYVFNTLGEIDLFGLDVKTGTGRTHVTYIGVKNGLPYVGYASAPSELNLTAQEIVNRRYGGNFK